MRHESIETTGRVYVGHNAEAAADELWRSVEVIEREDAQSQPQSSPQQSELILQSGTSPSC